ncbi:MAG: hypothetical protein ACREBW_04540 [Candidatus Micrarchaeaceae archaeon]
MVGTKAKPLYDRKYIAIRDWEKYRTSHGHTMPWLKLHVSVLYEDYWMKWSWTERGVWCNLILLRQRLERNLSSDLSEITMHLGVGGRMRQVARKVITDRLLDGHLVITNLESGYENSECLKDDQQKAKAWKDKIEAVNRLYNPQRESIEAA